MLYAKHYETYETHTSRKSYSISWFTVSVKTKAKEFQIWGGEYLFGRIFYYYCHIVTVHDFKSLRLKCKLDVGYFTSSELCSYMGLAEILQLAIPQHSSYDIGERHQNYS